MRVTPGPFETLHALDLLSGTKASCGKRQVYPGPLQRDIRRRKRKFRSRSVDHSGSAVRLSPSLSYPLVSLSISNEPSKQTHSYRVFFQPFRMRCASQVDDNVSGRLLISAYIPTTVTADRHLHQWRQRTQYYDRVLPCAMRSKLPANLTKPTPSFVKGESAERRVTPWMSRSGRSRTAKGKCSQSYQTSDETRQKSSIFQPNKIVNLYSA